MRRPVAIVLSALVAATGLSALAAGNEAGSAPDPVHGDSYYSYCLSRQAWFQQDYASALEYMRQAVKADPNSAELEVDLAQLHLELNQPDEAVAAARQAVTMAPSTAGPQRLLADALFAIAMRDNSGPEALDQALQAYRRVMELDPQDAEASLNLGKLQIAHGDLDAALESLKHHLELAPTSDEGAFVAAQVMVKLRRFEEAERLLDEAVERNPQNVQLALALVDVYEAQGDLESAVRAATRLSQLRVDPLRVHFVLARLDQKMGKPAEAYEHFHEMARLMDAQPAEFSEGDRAEVHLRMIQSLLDAGRTDDALAQASAGIGQFTTDPRFVLRKGEALMMARRADEAETLFREQRKTAAGRTEQGDVSKQVSDTYLSAAARQERSGSVAEAETLLKKSIDWNAQNGAALNYLGYMLADRGQRLDEAIGYIRKALEHDPKNGAYLDSLGWAYFKKQNYRDAQKLLEEAVSYMTEEPAIHEHLGDVYFATGRRVEAMKAWREAIDRGAENTDQIRAKLSAAGDTPQDKR